MTGTFSPACNSDPVSSSPQLWSLLRFPVAMVVVPTLEEEAWVLVGTVATPSRPVVDTAWAQVSEVLVLPPVAAGDQWEVAPASSLSPAHHPAGKVTSTEVASWQSPLPLPRSLFTLITGCLGPSFISSSQQPHLRLPGILASWLNSFSGL